MNINHKLALTLLTGVAIGLGAGTAIYAQQAKAPPAFVVAEPVVSDPDTFKKYAEQVPGTFAPFGGHYLIRGGQVDALEGDAPKRFVVIAFDNAEKAHAWEDSAAYLAIKPLRLKSAQTRVFIVQGVPAQ